MSTIIKIDPSIVAKNIIAEVNGMLESIPFELKSTGDHFDIARIYDTIYQLAEQAVAENRRFYGEGYLMDEALAVIDRFFCNPHGERRISALPAFKKTGITPMPNWLKALPK